MRITRILKLLLLTGLLSGCWGVHVKGETPESLGSIDLLDSFIGEKSESVVRELGLPRELLSDGEKQFMLYQATSDETTILMVTWVPVWAFDDIENTAHCLRIELDSDNVVKDYRLESRVIETLVLTFEVNLTSNCREVFWNEKELEKLQITTSFPSAWGEAIKQKQAEPGNVDGQLILFKNLSEEQPEEALIWLCKSADSGGQKARIILKTMYEYGGYPWIKEGIVERDFRLAYVWYALSGADLSSRQTYLSYLTSEERLEAEKMLEDWRPGQCEIDLGLVSVTE